tara:strand:- start:232 stop:483 length:252 start_codon:yes stop_codon:yes gene_type:complete
MTKKVTIIGKDDCSFCKNAVLLSEARKIPYEYLNVPNDLSLDEAFKMAEEMFTTFPFIFITDENGNKKKIGGFSEYRKEASSI